MESISATVRLHGMPTTRVFYHDRLVGTLSMTLGNHRCVFEYSPGWLSDGFSISTLELPLKSGLLLPKTDYFYGNFEYSRTACQMGTETTC